MIKNHLLIIIVLIFFVVNTLLLAKNEMINDIISMDAKKIFTKSNECNKTINSDSNKKRIFFLNQKFSNEYLSNYKNIIIEKFPIGLNEEATVELQISRSIIDANTKFLTQGSNGETELICPNAHSFKGIIKREPDSKVYLNDINGILIACVNRSDGRNYIIAPSLVESASVGEYLLIDINAYEKSTGFDFHCYTDEIEQKLPVSDKYLKPQKLSNEILEVELALETDTEFFKATGNSIEKAQAYALSLFSMVSAIYEEQLGITLYITWLKCWTDNPSDPYNAKGDPYTLRDKVISYWQDNYQDVERDVFHVMTSISYGGGGFGYFNALCGKNGAYGFSTSSVQGGHNLPTFAFTYDAYIIAHEFGHNFNGQHTHSCYWGYPLDTCVASDAIAEGCLDSTITARPNPGSIMSYCGGINNSIGLGYQVRMIFLPQNIKIMRQTAEEADCVTEPQEPSVFLQKPHGEEVFSPGEIINITWSSSRVNEITLEYSKDSGLTWILIDENVQSSLKSYDWIAPDICNNKLLVRIYDYINPEVTDTSLKTFSIIKDDPTGLIAYYPFRENSKDEQMCGFFNAAPYNNPILTDDRFENQNFAYSFDGSSYLKAGNFNLNFSEITLSFWFNTDSLTRVEHIVGTNWEESAYFSAYLWNGVLGGAFWGTGNGAPMQVWGGGVQSSKWQHGAVSYDGNYMKAYVDGKLTGSQEGMGNLKSGIAPLYIGARKDKEAFFGKIDDIRIYKRALTEQEILKLFNEANPVGIEDDRTKFASESLEVFPNPFSITTNIYYRIVKEGNIKLSLYNCFGEEVSELYSGYRNAGLYYTDFVNIGFNEGLYFCVLKSSGNNYVRKIIILR